MKKIIMYFVLLFSLNIIGQKTPKLIIDGISLSFGSDISLPYWVDEGKTVDLGVHASSISILEFNLLNNELQFNQVINLTSGATVTWAHHAILAGQKTQGMVSLAATIILAAIFTGFQVIEYIEAPFTITDGIYGSTFFMATGFHGFHVFIGTIFLFICLLRLNANQFSTHQHFGFEAAAWYWHFVDVVWLFLFVAIYWWGGL